MLFLNICGRASFSESRLCLKLHHSSNSFCCRSWSSDIWMEMLCNGGHLIITIAVGILQTGLMELLLGHTLQKIPESQSCNCSGETGCVVFLKGGLVFRKILDRNAALAAENCSSAWWYFCARSSFSFYTGSARFCRACVVVERAGCIKLKLKASFWKSLLSLETMDKVDCKMAILGSWLNGISSADQVPVVVGPSRFGRCLPWGSNSAEHLSQTGRSIATMCGMLIFFDSLFAAWTEGRLWANSADWAWTGDRLHVPHWACMYLAGCALTKWSL